MGRHAAPSRTKNRNHTSQNHPPQNHPPHRIFPYARTGALLAVCVIALVVLAKNTSDWAMEPAVDSAVQLQNEADPAARTADTYHLFGIPMDFQVYYRAGECVRTAGCDVYAHNFVTENNGQRWDLPFTYPPLVAWLFGIVSRLPLIAAAELWQLFALLALGGFIAAVLRERHIPLTLGSVPAICAVTLAAFAFEPVRAGFFWGQINMFVTALIAVDFLAVPVLAAYNDKNPRPGDERSRPSNRLHPEDPWWAGVGVDLAAGIKLFPAFFGFLFLLQRRYRAAAVAGGTFLTTVALGDIAIPGGFRAWWKTLFDVERFGGIDNPTSQSLRLWLQREVGVDSGVLWAALAVTVAVLTFASASRLLTAHNVTAAMAITGIGMSLVSPFSWHHYWLWVVPLAVGGVADVLRRTQESHATQPVHPARHFALGLALPIAALAVMWPFLSVMLDLPFDIWDQIHSGNALGRSTWIWWSLLLIAAPWLKYLVQSARTQPRWQPAQSRYQPATRRGSGGLAHTARECQNSPSTHR